MTRRPSPGDIARFLDRCRDVPLSYSPTGIVRPNPMRGRFDEQIVAVGHGRHDFDAARAALMAWKHFEIGWVEVFPGHAPVSPGTGVAVLIRHLGFWSLNGARVLYFHDREADRPACGFAYGTLIDHAESGEEWFKVFLDEQSGEVIYRIRAVSWPQSVWTRIGYPIGRLLQARFRRDSAATMKRATSRRERRA